MAIDKHCYISLRQLPPFFEHKHRIVYSKIELVNEISDIQHPAVRAVLTQFSSNVGMQIHHDGDLPARSGLGSSSSFMVGLIKLVKSFNGEDIGKEDLAKWAIHLERDVLQEHVGSQDQVWAAYGGLNRIEFGADPDFNVVPLTMNAERRKELLENFMLFFSGYYRIASEIAEKQIHNLQDRRQQIWRMMEIVDEAEVILSSPQRPLKEIGDLLHDSWSLKRELADVVSTPALDEIMEAALAAGARGGKVLGAGGGGFILFYVDPEHQDKVRNKLQGLVEVGFDIDEDGATIVL